MRGFHAVRKVNTLPVYSQACYAETASSPTLQRTLAAVPLPAALAGRFSASLEDRSFGRIAFDLGEFRRVVPVRSEHVVEGHHRRGAIIALQESVVKEVIAGATEAAVAKPGQVHFLGQCHKL